MLECGAACAVPRQKYGSEGITVTIREDHILVEPNHLGLACTPLSVSTFFLHENETSPVPHRALGSPGPHRVELRGCG